MNADLNAFLLCGGKQATVLFVPSGAYTVSVHADEVPIIQADVPARTAVTTAASMASDIVERLKFPITALSDALDIERKTIYDWWKGAEASADNAARLATLADAFKDEQDGSLRFFHRFWKRPLSNGATLREVLMSPTLDVRTIKQALAELRDAVLLSTSSDRGRNQLFSTGVNGHSGLSDDLEVGIRE